MELSRNLSGAQDALPALLAHISYIRADPLLKIVWTVRLELTRLVRVFPHVWLARKGVTHNRSGIQDVICVFLVHTSLVQAILCVSSVRQALSVSWQEPM